jgi:putative FmdB family regulatory protein
MPLYEYACDRCGKTFEVMQKFSDEPLTTHENCGGKIERLLSAPALQFKGTGWYITDYARNNGGSANGSAKTETKTDNKAEGKTETKASDTKASDTKASSTTAASEKK